MKPAVQILGTLKRSGRTDRRDEKIVKVGTPERIDGRNQSLVSTNAGAPLWSAALLARSDVSGYEGAASCRPANGLEVCLYLERGR